LVSERRESMLDAAIPAATAIPNKPPMSVLLAAEPARSVSSDEI